MSTTASIKAFKLKHILVATDLSPASVWSLPYVIEIGRQYGSTVYVGHVIPFGTYVAVRPQTFDAVEEEVRQGAQKKLDSLAIEIKDRGVPAKTLLTEGDVGVELYTWVKKHHIDLVVVSTTGRSGVRKLALGSIAEEIVRDARCPVLTVGPASSASKRVALRLRAENLQELRAMNLSPSDPGPDGEISRVICAWRRHTFRIAGDLGRTRSHASKLYELPPPSFIRLPAES